jgi:hypothetical protein
MKRMAAERSALDDLLGEFEANTGSMPQVNPPEAARVLATQTAPEVAGEPEPPEAEDKPPAPTEKPADVKAAEAAKARKPRASKPAAATPPDGWNNVPVGVASDSAILAAMELLACRLPAGVTLEIVGRG